MLSNCGAREDSWGPLDSKEIKPVNPKGNQLWIFIGRTDAEAEAPILGPTWCKQPGHWKRPWCWERLRARGEGDNRGWDGWMGIINSVDWVWTNSERLWRTEKLGMLQSMGSQSHTWFSDWTTTRIRYTLIYSSTLYEVKWSRSVVSNSLQPHGLQPTRLLRPWDFPGKSTGVGCHFLLQGKVPTQESNPGLPHCRQTRYRLSRQGSPNSSSIN